MTNEFLSQFREFLGKHGWPTTSSPWDAVESWEALVEQCAHCYQWGFYEFDNEIQVRGLLEQALADPKLACHEQLAEIRRRVMIADERFKQLLLSGTQIRGEGNPWWRRGVLARAGEEYREDMKRNYNIDVDPC